MGIFADTAQKFEKAASLVPSMVDKTIVVTEEQLLDLNRSQLKVGIKSDGQKITPKYSKPYKKAAKKPSFTPNLNVSGKYYKSLDVIIKATTLRIKGGYIISRSEDLGDILRKRYTEDIEGLTDKHIVIYSRKIFLPVFTKQLRNELQ